MKRKKKKKWIKFNTKVTSSFTGIKNNGHTAQQHGYIKRQTDVSIECVPPPRAHEKIFAEISNPMFLRLRIN